MTGKVDDGGKMTLAGKLEDGRSLAVSATVSGDSIVGGYGIVSGRLKSESGNCAIDI